RTRPAYAQPRGRPFVPLRAEREGRPRVAARLGSAPTDRRGTRAQDRREKDALRARAAERRLRAGVNPRLIRVRSICSGFGLSSPCMKIVMFFLALGIAAAAPQVTAKIQLEPDTQPCAAASGGKYIWVSEYASPWLVRIDPATNRVLGRTQIGFGSC